MKIGQNSIYALFARSPSFITLYFLFLICDCDSKLSVEVGDHIFFLVIESCSHMFYQSILHSTSLPTQTTHSWWMHSLQQQVTIRFTSCFNQTDFRTNHYSRNVANHVTGGACKAIYVSFYIVVFSILCTQLEPSITERLLLLKPNQRNVSNRMLFRPRPHVSGY